MLVASRVGGQVTLFAVVTAGSCPTVQWRVNRSAISHGDAGYIIGNPCRSHGSYTGTSTFNFTLTITANSATAGTYNATLTNAAGTKEVPDVFVTPPGIATGYQREELVPYCFVVVSCPLQFQC